MDENAAELFKNSIKHSDVPEEIIEKYRGKVSENIISLWREYGFCTTEDGYYKLVNPDDYADIFREIYGGSDKNPVVLFVTAMADIIFYDDDRYFNLVDIRHEKVKTIGDDFSMTMERIETADFRSYYLSWDLYEKAVPILGTPAYEECFAYEPLLSLGGKEKVENLRKVNLMVHLDIVSQMQDTVTW